MNTETVQIFSAVLALVVLAVAVVTAVALVLAARMAWASAWMATVEEVALGAVAAVSTATMAGSLYFSEVAGYAPCELCWYQRIGIYPVAIMSWVAVVRRDRRVAPYWIALSLAGLSVSVYHYLVEWYPSIATDVCSIDVPCTTVWFREFGFVTLAFMAGCAFIFVIVMSAVMVRTDRDGEE